MLAYKTLKCTRAQNMQCHPTSACRLPPPGASQVGGWRLQLLQAGRLTPVCVVVCVVWEAAREGARSRNVIVCRELCVVCGTGEGMHAESVAEQCCPREPDASAAACPETRHHHAPFKTTTSKQLPTSCGLGRPPDEIHPPPPTCSSAASCSSGRECVRGGMLPPTRPPPSCFSCCSSA